LSPVYANYVYFVINVLIICWATFVYEIMLELCVLARNISWLGGLALTWRWERHGFNSWWHTFSFLFAKNWYGGNI